MSHFGFPVIHEELTAILRLFSAVSPHRLSVSLFRVGTLVCFQGFLWELRKSITDRAQKAHLLSLLKPLSLSLSLAGFLLATLEGSYITPL